MRIRKFQSRFRIFAELPHERGGHGAAVLFLYHAHLHARVFSFDTHADAMIGEDRPELRQALKELQRALVSAQSVTGQLDRTLDANSENLDELLENLRHTSENLKEFTDTIKSRPSSLLRSSAPKDPKP